MDHFLLFSSDEGMERRKPTQVKFWM